MDRPFRIELFGGLRIVTADRVITRFQTQKTGALLAYLAYYLQAPHMREMLVEMLWPGSEPRAARNSLSVSLSSLRHILEPPGITAGSVIVANRRDISLNPAAIVTDVAEFDRLLKVAANASGASRVQALSEATALYNASLLTGYYEAWIVPEQQRRAEQYFEVARRLTEALVQAGNLAAAVETLRRTVRSEPLREEAHRDLMRLLNALGRPDEAVWHYRELEQALRQVMDAAPDAATQLLARQIETNIRRGPGTFPTPAPGAAPERDLSDQNARTGSVSEGAHASLQPGRGLQVSLPLQFTRFFGRETEIASLLRRLDFANPLSTPPLPRLITLTGPGGSGKTRLALEVAARLASSQQVALWFVSLADVTGPHRIPDVILEALRLPRLSAAEPLEQVVETLSRQSSLLLLDNFEHLVEGGAAWIGLLLSRVAGLRCLATSRRSLGLIGEQEFAVPPLPLPKAGDDLETLVRCDSVRLYVDRAQLVLPDFQVTPGNAASVAKLCSRLEGIPLALELAAARAQALTPAQMADRMANRFDLLVSRRRGASTRQQTLRAALDWSYDLLSPELRALFARLAVFRGGWTLDAAESVVAGESSVSVLDALSQLRECSLIEASDQDGEMRFRMLETLREYAAEKLPSEEEPVLRARHASHFLAFAQRADKGVRGQEQTAWLARLEIEHDNLRTALGWTAEHDIETGLRLLSALTNFWGLHSHLKEAREWLKRILDRSGGTPPELRIAPLKEAGRFAMEQGDYEEAEQLLKQSLELSRECNDPVQAAGALHAMGTVALYRGNGDTACALHSESLAIMRRIDHRPGIAAALMGLSQVACNQGEYGHASYLIEQALPICRELADRQKMAILLTNLGKVRRLQGDYDRATECYHEALILQDVLGDRIGAARVLGNLGNLADDRGQPELACTLHRESLEIQRELGDKQGMTISLYNLATVTQSLGNYAEALKYHQESLKLCLELTDRLGVAYSLEELAGILLVRNNGAVAAQLSGAAEALREEIDSPVPPLQQPRHDDHRAALARALGQASCEANWSAGRSLSWQDAVAVALAVKGR